jgi:hypothetical protein
MSDIITYKYSNTCIKNKAKSDLYKKKKKIRFYNDLTVKVNPKVIVVRSRIRHREVAEEVLYLTLQPQDQCR